MIIDKITSRHNPLVKRFRLVRQGQERHLILIEGIRLLEEALNTGIHLETIAYTEQLHANPRGAELYEKLNLLACRGALVTTNVMAAMSDLESPPGVIAIAHLPYAKLEDLMAIPSPFIVIAHQLQDPGNLGTIIRTAEASGATGLITTVGTVDPFNLKALRAAMGSAFRLPLVINGRLPAIAQLCKEKGVQLVAAVTEQQTLHTDFDWQQPTALLLGQEANGLDKVSMTWVEKSVYVPMSSSVESLNVATAAAILLYEAARQRQFQFPDISPST